MDYMLARVPILFAIEAGNDPVSEAGCGISVAAENPPEVIKAIQSFSELNLDELRDMGNRGHQYALENYSYKVLAERFLVALNGL